jgi:hypothetical protein
MLNFIGTTIKTISFLLLSGFIAGYSTEEIYKYMQKETFPKSSGGLLPSPESASSLICKILKEEGTK